MAAPGAVEAEVGDLYARAGEAAVTLEQVRAACDRLGGLTKDALVKVAEGIEVHGARGKTKGDLVRLIAERLVDRTETAIRRTLIDRPAATPGQLQVGQARPEGEPHVLSGGHAGS
jgi:hypothetical protein